MGPLRGGVVLAIYPGSVVAEVCDKVRPNWTGEQVSAVGEAVLSFSTVPSLVLLLATALAIRLRSQWGALAVVVLWTIWISIISMTDAGGLKKLAIEEGCMGSPTLFIAVVAAICVGTILYTTPRQKRD